MYLQTRITGQPNRVSLKTDDMMCRSKALSNWECARLGFDGEYDSVDYVEQSYYPLSRQKDHCGKLFTYQSPPVGLGASLLWRSTLLGYPIQGGV